MDQQDANMAMVKMIDVFNTGNLAEIADLIDGDYVDHQGIEGRGPDVFRRVLDSSRRHGPPTVVIEDLISEEDPRHRASALALGEPASWCPSRPTHD